MLAVVGGKDMCIEYGYTWRLGCKSLCEGKPLRREGCLGLIWIYDLLTNHHYDIERSLNLRFHMTLHALDI
jgi:hypothetical protein